MPVVDESGRLDSYLRSIREQDDEICVYTISLYSSQCLVLVLTRCVMV
jgi:hypothetical protein